MSPHDLPSDAAFELFLSEISLETARLDLLPHTETEIRHLTRARRTA